MANKLQRQQPLHLQIHDFYARKIADGELAPGDRLPTVQEIADEFGVAHGTALRAVGLLKSGKLVTTTRDGTFVGDLRLVLGPQQRLTATRYPTAGRTEVTAAEYLDAPEYIVPILGLELLPGDVTPVIRREQVSYAKDGQPFMLSVSWFPPTFYELVPELTRAEPIDGPGGAAKLIEQRTGRTITRGRQSREARLIKDDGREGPLLHLEPETAVLAEAYLWLDDTDVLEYGEYVLVMNRVTENEYAI